MNFIYQDEHILVVNKPAGVAVLVEGWEPEAPFMVKMLEENHGKIWVVHRLDKTTSGVIVFARTAEAHRSLNIQFEKHQVQKTYHAIVNGSPPWDDKVTRFPLRVNVGHKHRTMVDDRHGQRSETRFRVLSRAAKFSLLEALPMTGRTHQIRVHAYALGLPLLGDTLYSAPETHWIARPALHAHALTLTHPATNEQVTFTAPYAPDFARALSSLKLT